METKVPQPQSKTSFSVPLPPAPEIHHKPIIPKVIIYLVLTLFIFDICLTLYTSLNPNVLTPKAIIPVLPSITPFPTSHYQPLTPTPNPKLSLKSLNLNLQNFPVIDGATATQPLRALIACKALGWDYEWQETPSREMFVYPKYPDEKDKYTYVDWSILNEKITTSKTHDAYVKLINGDVDLIINATLPSIDEAQLAKKQSVYLDPTPIGSDGFVFLVNKNNPVKNLTTDQIKKIYTKQITNWRDVGGPNQVIEPFVRQKNSGSQELMEKVFMKGTPMGQFPEEQRIDMMMTLIEGVDKNPNSIGYSLYYYKKTMVDRNTDNPDVKVISVDGVLPSPQSISSSKYPYIFNIYAITRDDLSPGSLAYKIKQWLIGSEGQTLVSQAGYSTLSK